VFLIGNKLTDLHIRYEESIQNVNLAAQTLSNSVANAFKLVESRDKLFETSAATARYCRLMNNAFEILTVRKRYNDTLRHPFLLPLNDENEAKLKEEAMKIETYILGLKNDAGSPLV